MMSFELWVLATQTYYIVHTTMMKLRISTDTIPVSSYVQTNGSETDIYTDKRAGAYEIITAIWER